VYEILKGVSEEALGEETLGEETLGGIFIGGHSMQPHTTLEWHRVDFSQSIAHGYPGLLTLTHATLAHAGPSICTLTLAGLY
jgi:hypothetical protein